MITEKILRVTKMYESRLKVAQEFLNKFLDSDCTLSNEMKEKIAYVLKDTVEYIYTLFTIKDTNDESDTRNFTDMKKFTLALLTTYLSLLASKKITNKKLIKFFKMYIKTLKKKKLVNVSK